ncbi:MAG: peptidase M48 [Beijerinckiaceae bacterium]|nr:MAG: peptidase M48 [Beijerinckiaceae bacterium]
MDILARYFDGVRPVAQAVTLRRVAAGLEIVLPDGRAPILWPYAEARIDALTPEVQLHRVRQNLDTGERLIASAEAFQREFGSMLASFGRGRAGEAGAMRIALWCALAVASLAFLFFVGLPVLARVAAPMVPWRWEAALGRSVEPQVLEYFSKEKDKPIAFCGGEASAGTAALQAMVSRLSAGANLPAPVRVDVLDTPMTNAFALPGGRIFIFRPIIDKAMSPDEVAGVLAHEIGHVVHRDAMRGLIHNGALSLLIGAVLGDITGGSTIAILSKMMLGSAYSRETESEADRVSVDLMRRAGADPRAINDFFRRISPLGNATPTIFDALSSHPVTSERIAAVEALAAAIPKGGKPILEAQEWAALKAICAQTVKPAKEAP